MKRLTFLVAGLAGLFLFSGCGQSGPLYVPGNPSQMAVPPATDTANEVEKEEDEDAGEPSETD
jgi:predicted small lipoprotein YifL